MVKEPTMAFGNIMGIYSYWPIESLEMCGGDGAMLNGFPEIIPSIPVPFGSGAPIPVPAF